MAELVGVDESGSTYVNCYADKQFQVRIKTPVNGILTYPTAGDVTGILLRLSATPTGAAIHANVGALATAEITAYPGRFFKNITTSLLVTHILPLGVGASFYAIWSKASALDMHYTRFIVADRLEA